MDLATIVKPKSAKHLKEKEEIHGEHGLTKKHLTVILKIPPIKIPESWPSKEAYLMLFNSYY